MLKIRLARYGRKHLPFYRIVVVDTRNYSDSNFVSLIGTYSPLDKKISINVENYNLYLKQGAQPSETVGHLYKNFCKKQSINK